MRRDNDALYLLRYNRGRLWHGCARGYDIRLVLLLGYFNPFARAKYVYFGGAGGCLGLSSLGC